MFHVRAWLLAGLAAIYTITFAQAGPSDKIFTAERQRELCTIEADGERHVSRGALAMAMFTDARLPVSLLAKESQIGVAERAIEIMGDANGLKDKQVTKAQIASFTRQRAVFAAFLVKEGASKNPSNKNYSVRTNANVNTLSSLVPRSFFGRPADPETGQREIKPIITIVCLDVPDKSAKGAPTFGAFVDTAAKHIRIRGKLEHLPLKKVDAAKPAEVSFTDNLFSDEETVQIDGVVGIVTGFRTADTLVSMIPFVEYHNKTTARRNAPTSRVETLGFGVLFNALVSTPPVAWELSLAPQYVLDEAQNNQLLKGQAFLDPSFSIGPDITVGRYNILFNGNLWIKPDITVIAEAGRVETKGKSPILIKGDEFYGIGGEASLHLFFPNIPLFENLILGGSYRYLELFSLPIDHAAKWTATAEYSLDAAKHFTVSLEYQNGRNEQTFQDEEFWKLALGIRF